MMRIKSHHAILQLFRLVVKTDVMVKSIKDRPVYHRFCIMVITIPSHFYLSTNKLTKRKYHIVFKRF